MYILILRIFGVFPFIEAIGPSQATENGNFAVSVPLNEGADGF